MTLAKFYILVLKGATEWHDNRMCLR